MVLYIQKLWQLSDFMLLTPKEITVWIFGRETLGCVFYSLTFFLLPKKWKLGTKYIGILKYGKGFS